MKIGIITYSFNIGGVSTFILSLGKYFIEKGHTVEVITEEDRGPWFDEIRKNGIPSDYISCGLYAWLPFGIFIHSYRVGNLIKRKKFDVVILNHCLYAQLSAHLYNSNAVVIPVVHNNNFGVYQTATRNITNISAISCVSLATFNGIKKYTNFEQIVCIPNGIQLPQVEPCFPKSPNGDLNIIFVGHLMNEQKGIFFIPHILKLCKESSNAFNIHLTIVGEGKDKEELVRLLKEEDVLDLVTFEGNIPREKVYELYLKHNIFLMPSFYEGLPMTLIESMACGCVPIVSFLKDITDYCINDNVEGYLCPIGDENLFAEKIINLGLNPSLIDRMGKSSYTKAKNIFSIQRMGNDYLNLIKDLSDSDFKLKGFSLSLFSWKDIFPRKGVLLFKKYLRKVYNKSRSEV